MAGAEELPGGPVRASCFPVAMLHPAAAGSNNAAVAPRRATKPTPETRSLPGAAAQLRGRRSSRSASRFAAVVQRVDRALRPSLMPCAAYAAPRGDHCLRLRLALTRSLTSAAKSQSSKEIGFVASRADNGHTGSSSSGAIPALRR